MTKIYLADSRSLDNRSKKMINRFASKLSAVAPGSCPVTMQLVSLYMSRTQCCTKCTPCRVGHEEAVKALESIVRGDASMETLEQLKKTANLMAEASDCAIGYQMGLELLEGLEAFKDEYMSHIEHGMCQRQVVQDIPCVNLCPAHVDIPGYIAHVNNEDYASAINLIRRDNPLPTACAMICEHPCEEQCRRQLLDAPLNIRGIKKYAVDQIAADKVAIPDAMKSTGKKVAIIGGGPSGMTAAYFLSLMGHSVTVYEAKERLGGMLMYGIPNYRFPKDRLDEDMRAILSTGNIEVKYNVSVGKDISIEEVRNSADAMYVAIGAQAGKKLRMEGVDAGNVFSAGEMLDEVGHGHDGTGDYGVVVALDVFATGVGGADVLQSDGIGYGLCHFDFLADGVDEMELAFGEQDGKRYAWESSSAAEVHDLAAWCELEDLAYGE